MKTQNVLTIEFTKTNRKNAKTVNYYTFAVNNYDIMTLYSAVSDFILNDKELKARYVRIRCSKYYIADKGLSNRAVQIGESERILYSSIEQYINVISGIMIALNEENNKDNEELLHCHDNIIIRQQISKYYN